MKKVFFVLIAIIQLNIALSQNHLVTSNDNRGSTCQATFSTVENDLRSSEIIIEGSLNSADIIKKTNSFEPYVRPFITDDARVVGYRLSQLETWMRIDKEAGQQWVMVAYGPSKKLELSLGGVFGYQVGEHERASFSYGLPLIQAKYLFRQYAVGKGPGFGIVAGSFLPTGKGSFKPAGYGTFSFLTVSQALGEGEKVLLHVNTGFNYLHINGEHQTIGTWGFGSQVRTIGGFHLVGEIFSGDPYVPGAGTSFQAGFRHFFSDLLQVDMTIGKGIAGAHPLPLWFSPGVRIVSQKFLKKK